MPPDNLRFRLRHATGDAHARLDAELGALDLTRRADYRRFLEISVAGLLPLEQALEVAGVAGFFPDWPQRTRRTALLSDLVQLGGQVHPLPAPLLRDSGAVLGVMYVLEGSRLGARVLLNSVAQSRDPDVLAATAYLRHGEGSDLWRSFLVQLEQHAATLKDDAGAIAAARFAFDLFLQASEAVIATVPAAEARLAPA